MINRSYSIEIGDVTLSAKKWTPRQALQIAKMIQNVLTHKGQTIQSLFSDSAESLYKGAIADQVNKLHDVQTNNAEKNGLEVFERLINFLHDLSEEEDLFYGVIENLLVDVMHENSKISSEMLKNWPAVIIFKVIKVVLAENNFLS